MSVITIASVISASFVPSVASFILYKCETGKLANVFPSSTSSNSTFTFPTTFSLLFSNVPLPSFSPLFVTTVSSNTVPVKVLCSPNLKIKYGASELLWSYGVVCVCSLIKSFFQE